MYTPNCWVVLKISKEHEIIYKLLAGRSGGYLDGDSWRMNSGIVAADKDDDYYSFTGHSGSVYKCHFDGYGIRMSTAGIYQTLVEQASQKDGVNIELMPEGTDWLELFNKGGDL